MSNQQKVEAPQAKQKAKDLLVHADKRVDPYYWLSERDNPEVAALLAAENAYTQAKIGQFADLTETLYQEIKGRIVEADTSAAYKDGSHWYFSRTLKDKAYAQICRKQTANANEFEVLLDLNELAVESKFCELGSYEASPNGRLLAYTVDFSGDCNYELYIKDITSDAIVEHVPGYLASDFEWSACGEYVFYTKCDPTTFRAFQIVRHKLGSSSSADVTIFTEEDTTFSCHLSKSKSREYIFIVVTQTLTTEYLFLPAAEPLAVPKVIMPRVREHEYYIDHVADKFYIQTNRDGAKNFKLQVAAQIPLTDKDLTDVVVHREDVLVEDIELFAEHFAVQLRRNNCSYIEIYKHGDITSNQVIGFDADVPYALEFGDNAEPGLPTVRVEYSSLADPPVVYDYNLKTNECTTVKTKTILGGFKETNYRQQRLNVKTEDGAMVPVSLIYHKDTSLGTNALLLYAYGAYGYSIEASFSSHIISLLDRGFVYAIAHVRGGRELGQNWYEAGKLLQKKNTFYDFITVAKYLLTHNFVAKDKLYAAGGSAGGLTVGAAVNMQPELFRAVVMHVPFVDVITTMLDEDLPLTTGEYDEWGSPYKEQVYKYMLEYSPYDNIIKQPYPHMLINTGINDAQVQYFEPLKYVAKIRACNTQNTMTLLKINMEAGHKGASSRYEYYREVAVDYAFLLNSNSKTSAMGI